MAVKFAESRLIVLLATYRMIRAADGQVWFNSETIHSYCPANLSLSYVQLILEGLEHDGLLEGDGGNPQMFLLTADGIEAAEEYAEALGVLDQIDSGDYRADEVIEIESARRVEALSVLDELNAALERGNDVGELSATDLVLAKQELSAVAETLSLSRVRVAALASQAKTSLSWIAEKAGASLIGELAKRALNFILDMLS